MKRHVPVWAREAPAPDALSRERIVATAIAVADAEGIDAVSIRRLAAELSARPMSLYRFIASKDDLLELMYDAAIRETLLGQVPEDWQQALRAIARRTRAVNLRHPWLTVTLNHGARTGPATLSHMNESAAALRSLDADLATKRTLLVAVDTYTLGYVRLELAGKIHPRQDDDGARQAAVADYIRREIAGGKYPDLAGFDPAAMLTEADAEAAFERGLDWLLAGAAAALVQ